LLKIKLVKNNFLTDLASIGPTSYLTFSKTKVKAYLKNKGACSFDSIAISKKIKKLVSAVGTCPI
jgi:hypothetical protein